MNYVEYHQQYLTENYIYISFQIEWDMIVVTVFLSTLRLSYSIKNERRFKNSFHSVC